MTSVAIMQPYFFPYAGYYRLAAAADIFVLLDCVQFPRRGWVHRNKFTKQDGTQGWFTLPLTKSDYHSLILSQQFANDADEIIKQQINSYPHIFQNLANFEELSSFICNTQGSVVDYLEDTIDYTLKALDYRPQLIRSSSLKIPTELRGQQRIEEICRQLEARCYINLEGGVNYYKPDGFEQRGIELKVLAPYQGERKSLLERLLTETAINIRKEIQGQLQFYKTDNNSFFLS
ncbi:WbqC family protein [Kiloniella litopenaei]|uniref:WbqC family protein n=1 Tax=Kiloniella litopenaei TaxID=1549748 RepID=UPI0006976E94|nr:WbqC family protein [Kiloniella litopenaei]